MTAVNQIIAQLNEMFADMDAQVAERNRQWGIARRDAIKAKREELQPQRRAIGEWKFYEAMFTAAGGKTWFHLLDGCRDSDVAFVMDRNSRSVAAKRNASIAAKLVKAEITEVIDSSYQHTNDGFNGTFVVETNKGRKRVTIDTIYAGGYNIQCFHLRVLVKVK